jgi:hypothetical protein
VQDEIDALGGERAGDVVAEAAGGTTFPACSTRRCLGLDSARRLARCPSETAVTRRPGEAAD